jgi:hypothetical protein
MISRSRTVLAVLIAASAMATTCMDLTPVTDVPLRDAGNIPVEGGAACLACIQRMPDGGEKGCGDLLATCYLDAQCAQIFDCLIALGCAVRADPWEAKICGIPCAADAGIFSADAPQLKIFFQIQDCIAASCPVCANGQW